MRFGVSTHVLKELSVADALKFIAHTGFKAAEVWTSDLRRTGESTSAIVRMAHQLELRLSIHGPALEFDALTATVTEKSIKRIINAIKVAGQVGATTVVIHPPRRWRQGYHPKLYWHRLEIALSRLALRAQKKGVVLALEGMDGGKPEEIITKPDDIKRVMSLGLPNFRLCLDMAHIQGVMDPLDFLDRIDTAWLHHIHLSDRSEKHHHLPLGEGTMPITEILEKLDRFYVGSVIIEGRRIGRGKSVVQSNFRYLSRCGVWNAGVIDAKR